MCTKPRSTFRFADGLSSLSDLIRRNKNAVTVTELILDNPPPPQKKKYREGEFLERRPWKDTSKMGREHHEGISLLLNTRRWAVAPLNNNNNNNNNKAEKILKYKDFNRNSTRVECEKQN
jgi:hypothetical protein